MSITLATIHDIALRMSGRNYSASYARDLRHIAMDCKSAMEGCEASLASVDEWLEHDPAAGRLYAAGVGKSA